jgi:LPS export ABC transporter protein LptC
MLGLGAAAVASWIYSRPEPVSSPRRSGGDDTPLGYYLRGARIVGTDEEGREAYRISADRLEEETGDDRLLFENLEIEYHPSDEVAWTITAGAGSGPKDRSQFELGDRVEVHSDPTDGSAPVHIVTDSLTFDPDTSTAESDATTHLRVGDWQLSGNRLRANLKDGRLKLESEVHGKFSR